MTMIPYLRFGLVLATLILFSRMSLACDDKPVYVERLVDGRTFAIFMERTQVEQSPVWKDEGMSEMTWMAASKYLAKWADERYKHYDEWKYFQIRIEGFECPELAQHRFYLFHLVVIKDGKKTIGREHFAAVLLDGTVFGPTEITENEYSQNYQNSELGLKKKNF